MKPLDFWCWMINKFGPVYLLMALFMITQIAR